MTGRPTDWFDAALVADSILAGWRGDSLEPRLIGEVESSSAILPFRSDSGDQVAESQGGHPAIMAQSIDLSDYILDEEEDPDEVPATRVEALAASSAVDDFRRPIPPPLRLPYGPRFSHGYEDHDYYNEGYDGDKFEDGGNRHGYW